MKLAGGWAQIRELWRGMPTSTRLALVLLVAMVGGSLVYLWSSTGEGPTTFVLGGQEFSGSELARAEAALRGEGLVDFELVENRIRVPAGRSAVYTAALAKGDALPVTFYSAFDRVVKERSPWSSSMDQDKQWDLARQKELANILRHLREIEDASVLLDRAAPKGLSRQSADVRASVSVKPRAGHRVSPQMGHKIRSLVAGAVTGLSADQVTVTDLTSEGPPLVGGEGTGEEERIERQRAAEKLYHEKISRVVSNIPGVVVTVNVATDELPVRKKAESETQEGTSSSRGTEAQSPEHHTGAGSQQPGAGSQQPGASSNVEANAAVHLGRPAVGSAASQTASEGRRGAGVASSQPEAEPLGPASKTVTVAIGVPSTWYDAVWKLRGRGAAATALERQALEREEATKIEERVRAVVPTEATISVHSLTQVPAEPAGWARWLERARALASPYRGAIGLGVLAMIAAGAAGLLAAKRRRVEEARDPTWREASTAAGERPQAENADVIEERGDGAEIKLRRSTVVRKKVGALVGANPEAAVGVLKRWVTPDE